MRYRGPRPTLDGPSTLVGIYLPQALHAPVSTVQSGAECRLAIVRSRLQAAKRIAHAHDAKVNDVALAAVAGGLRQLPASRGEDIQELTLRAMVPISLHQEQSRCALAAAHSRNEETMASIRELLFPLKPRRDGAVFDGFVPNLAADRFPLEELTVPTLILNARDDHLAPYRFAVEAASRIPAAKLVSIDTGGHIFMGHGNEVREAIQAFVRAAA
jgi:pimeloyl-ACP methyl ester carboxylesterase